MNVIKKLIIVLSLMISGNPLVYGDTFSQWASSNGISGSATEIYAINADITDLSGLANNYPNLTVLVLWGNPLNSIDSDDFDGLGNLTELYLNENQITSLESGDFNGLDNLKYLYLNDNQISSLQSGDFDGLGNLERLDLGGNQISSIESDDFDGLGNLTELYVGDNQITSLESGDFDGPTNLIGLYLDNNQIADIESSDFTGLGDLTCLSLSGNQLTSIDSGDFATLGNLTELYLGDNQLTGIESGDFAALANLTALYLNGNQITSIESGGFSGLSNLTELYLSDNLLTSIESGDFAGLGNLTKLYLSGNQLTSIESGDFDGLASLAELYLRGNQIETMDFSNSDLSLLRSFDIVANPITSMQLVDATLSQASFNALINGGQLWCFGIAEISGVVELDMSGVDFSGISDISRMHTMDTLEQLLLTDATNITGSDVSDLTAELASLRRLNVIGLWDTFDPASQSTLNAWDVVPGNVLITTPVPGDFDGDGDVDGDDLTHPDDGWKALYGTVYDGSDFLLWQRNYTGSLVSVPNVFGFTQGNANTAITNLGFVVGGSPTDDYHATVAVGLVIGTNPDAGSLLFAGGIVNLVVSLGPAPIPVPNVVNLSLNDAYVELTFYGLLLGPFTNVYHPTIAAGYVISSTPVAGTVVLPGAVVDLVVSLGPLPTMLFPVPTVFGLSQVAAGNAITGVGLVVGGSPTYEYHASVAVDLVIGTNPPAGTSLPIGDTVSLEVSLGPPPPVDPVEILSGWTSGTAHAAPAGNNRALVFIAHVENTGSTSVHASVSYGGQPMSLIVEQDRNASAYVPYVAMFILDEAGIASASDPNFVVSWDITPNRTPSFSSILLEDVDPNVPVGASDGNFVDSSTTVSTSALATSDGDFVVVAATHSKDLGAGETYVTNNGFTSGYGLDGHSISIVAGHRIATGSPETPSVTHSLTSERQVIVGAVIHPAGYLPPPAASSAAGEELLPAMLSASSVAPAPLSPSSDAQVVVASAETDSETSSLAPPVLHPAAASAWAMSPRATGSSSLRLLILKARLRQVSKEVRQGKTHRAERRLQELLSELNDMLSDTAETDPQRKRVEQVVESVKTQLAEISGG